ncbi:thioredoxin family protein [Agromyces atrinae]|uniref:TlpA family protein disulfide reductase n=1 Tax=Agromyces atrinae TaxID=592376 RepID=UPI001F572B00|nr:thioredoxin family protein [Agromyces atrinae]MCI2958307.1 thioredoxin family protein [Agromyces atrinae]
MEWSLAIGAAVALVVATTIGGLIWSRRQGAVRAGGLDRVSPADVGVDAFGRSATLVQFSTEFCSRCPGTARALGSIAAEREGVDHIDVDLTHRADLASAFRVTQTPTTLIVDGDGIVRARIGGPPRPDAVREQLDLISRSSHV